MGRLRALVTRIKAIFLKKDRGRDGVNILLGLAAADQMNLETEAYKVYRHFLFKNHLKTTIIKGSPF